MHVEYLYIWQIEQRQLFGKTLVCVVPKNNPMVFSEESLVQTLGQLLGVHPEEFLDRAKESKTYVEFIVYRMTSNVNLRAAVNTYAGGY